MLGHLVQVSVRTPRCSVFPEFAVILIGEQDQMTIMDQPTNQGGGYLSIVQNVHSAGELQVRIKDNGFLPFNLGNIVKKVTGHRSGHTAQNRIYPES